MSENKPEEFSFNNYPNPFNPSTVISYQIPEDDFVTIKVYNLEGREIKTLVHERKEAGYYNLQFDGNKLSSGIYICVMMTSRFTKSNKMLLLR